LSSTSSTSPSSSFSLFGPAVPTSVAASVLGSPSAPAAPILAQVGIGAPLPAGLEAVTVPVLPAQLLAWQMRNFPPETYSLRLDSHVVRLMGVYAGDAGAGQLLRRVALRLLGTTLSGTRFGTLDQLWGRLFGVQRAASELLPVNPSTGSALDVYTDTATPSIWQSAHAVDASYRSRLFGFAQGIGYGATLRGVAQIAEAVLGTPVDVYERFAFPAQALVPSSGQLTNLLSAHDSDLVEITTTTTTSTNITPAATSLFTYIISSVSSFSASFSVPEACVLYAVVSWESGSATTSVKLQDFSTAGLSWSTRIGTSRPPYYESIQTLWTYVSTPGTYTIAGNMSAEIDDLCMVVVGITGVSPTAPFTTASGFPLVPSSSGSIGISAQASGPYDLVLFAVASPYLTSFTAGTGATLVGGVTNTGGAYYEELGVFTSGPTSQGQLVVINETNNDAYVLIQDAFAPATSTPTTTSTTVAEVGDWTSAGALLAQSTGETLVPGALEMFPPSSGPYSAVSGIASAPGVVPGLVYTAAGRFQAVSASSEVAVGIVWVQSDGSLVPAILGGERPDSSVGVPIGDFAPWTFVMVSATAPTDASSAVVEALASGTDYSGPLPVPSPPALSSAAASGTGSSDYQITYADQYGESLASSVASISVQAVAVALDMYASDPVSGPTVVGAAASGSISITTAHDNEVIVVVMGVYGQPTTDLSCSVDGVALSSQGSASATSSATNAALLFDGIIPVSGTHTLAWVNTGTIGYGIFIVSFQTIAGVTTTGADYFSSGPGYFSGASSPTISNGYVVSYQQLASTTLPASPTWTESGVAGVVTELSSGLTGDWNSWYVGGWEITSACIISYPASADSGWLNVGAAYPAVTVDIAIDWSLPYRNLIPDSAFADDSTATAGWTVGSAGWTVGSNWTAALEAPSGPAPIGMLTPNWYVATRANTTAGNGYVVTGSISVPSGSSLVFSVYLKASVDGPYSLVVSDQTGAVQQSEAVQVTTTWERYSFAFKVWAETTSITCWITDNPNTAPVAGTTISMVGFQLEYQPSTNVLSPADASFETGVGSWGGGANEVSAVQSTAEALDGSHSLLVTMGTTPSTNNWVAQQGQVAVVPGATYTAFASVYPLTAATFWMDLLYFDANGTYIEDTYGPTANLAANAWAQVPPQTSVPPSNAAFATIDVRLDTTVASQQFYVDEAGIFPGTVTTWTAGGFAGVGGAIITRSDGNYARGASQAHPVTLPAPSQQATVDDYEVPPNNPYSYTAVTQVVVNSTVTLTSPASAASSDETLTTSGWWELDPTNPSSAVSAQVTNWQPVNTLPATAHQVMGQKVMNFVQDVPLNQDFSATFEVFHAAIYDALEALLTSGATIFISSPFAATDTGWFKVGPQSGGLSTGNGVQTKQATLLPSTAAAPHRTIQITAIAAARPPT